MQPTTQPLVTVLTPVYNGEKYLAECIESVLAQTYSNWEYCIINNRSTDRSLEIANSYAARDPRVRVITNVEFVGIIENHNIAFRQVSSESKYCKVLHAPDWLFPDCLTKMVELAEANPSVAIVGAYSLKNDKVICDGLPYPSTVKSGKEICRNTLLGGSSVFGTPTTILFAADVVRCRPDFYNEGNFHADFEACFDVLRDRDFGFVHQVLTYSRVFKGNASEFDKTCLFLPEIETHLKYGPVYLTDDEHKREMERMWAHYYTFLGTSLCRNREKEFWVYHRKALNRLGYSLRHERVAKAVVIKVFDLLLNPLNTALRLAGRIGGRFTYAR